MSRRALDWNKFGRPRIALLNRLMARFLIAMAALSWPIFLVLALRDWTVIFAPLVLTGLVAMEWMALQKIYAGRPDYAAIARMERDIFGEAFEHEGAPQVSRPQRQTCSCGHRRAVTGACWVCEDRRYRLEGPLPADVIRSAVRAPGERPARWVRTYENGADYVESIDGIPWTDAPLPPARHACRPQTRGWFTLSYAERCACGAARSSVHGPWIEKNQTRSQDAAEGETP